MTLLKQPTLHGVNLMSFSKPISKCVSFSVSLWYFFLFIAFFSVLLFPLYSRLGEYEFLECTS